MLANPNLNHVTVSFFLSLILARSRSEVPFSRPISGGPIQSSREHVDRLYVGDYLVSSCQASRGVT